MRKIIISIFIILIIWIIISCVFKPKEYLFPSAISVGKAFCENYEMFLENILYTLIEVLIGFLIANILGLILAILAIYYHRIEQILTVLSITLKTIPIIAIAPLLVLWFGHGMGSKIMSVVITCFIPIFINVLTSAKGVKYQYNNIIKLYNLKKYQELFYFIIPGVAPSLISAFKISSSLAIVGALVSEFISANKGLGYLIISNYYSMNIANVFVCIILSSLMGIIIYYTCDMLEKKYLTY